MSNLIIHAREELTRAGLFDKDSDYDGGLGPAIMRLIEVFSDEHHSGMSADITLAAFNRVVNFKTLSPLTNDPAEWMNVSEYGGPNDAPIWQNRRDGSYFSHDGGKTGYTIDDEKRENKTFQEAKI